MKRIFIFSIIAFLAANALGREHKTSAPTITALSPTSGTIAGGTAVTIAGENLSNATKVLFGKTAAKIKSDSSTTIDVTTPAESAGTVGVTVTTAGGTSAAVNFVFTTSSTTAPPPPPPTTGRLRSWIGLALVGYQDSSTVSAPLATFVGRSSAGKERHYHPHE